MPMLGTRASMSVRGFGFGSRSYVKALMVRTGSTGTITPNSAGYSLSGFDNITYAYLDAGKSAGKWYWEVSVVDFIYYGVTVTPATVRTLGGYNTINAGIYNLVGTFWDQWGSAPSAAGPIASGAVMGFALDVGGKTLDVYVANVLVGTVPLTSITTPIYPMFALDQSGPAAQINLGPGNTTYAPPTGFAYI